MGSRPTDLSRRPGHEDESVGGRAAYGPGGPARHAMDCPGLIRSAVRICLSAGIPAPDVRRMVVAEAERVCREEGGDPARDEAGCDAIPNSLSEIDGEVS